MKLFFAFLLFLNHFSLNAQSFKNDFFIISHLSMLNGKNEEPIGGGGYYLFWDTCINNQMYKYLSVWTDLPKNCNISYKRWLLRIEPMKIFIYYPNIGVEKTLYDMSKTIGDTIRISSPKIIKLQNIICSRFDTVPSEEHMRIVIKDTLINYGGIIRKTLYFNDSFTAWAAGLGSLHSHFLDPFGQSRYDSSYVGELFGFLTKNEIYYHLFDTIYPYIYNAASNWRFPPFYISQNCSDPSHPDTIQLDTSLCYRPENYQNIALKLDKVKYACGDTVRAKLDIAYAPPAYSYQWIPDSVMVVRPYNNLPAKITLNTKVSNPICNKYWESNIPTSCKYCSDTLYNASIQSNQSRDTFYCPEPILRNYTAKGKDTSIHWQYLNPLPIVYSNQIYTVKNIVYNSYCRDTITTDTLLLICNTPCSFAQQACAHIESDKNIIFTTETVQYSAICDSHCIGFSYQWDNGRSQETLPLNYTDSTFIKKLIYWNSYGIKDTAIHLLKVKQKSGVSNIASNLSIQYENPHLIIHTSQKIDDISIYDMLGNLVWYSKETDIIDLSKFETGLYLLKVNVNEAIWIKKIIR